MRQQLAFRCELLNPVKRRVGRIDIPSPVKHDELGAGKAASGCLYVADTMNYRIQKFAAQRS